MSDDVVKNDAPTSDAGKPDVAKGLEKTQESGLTPGEIELVQGAGADVEPGETTPKVVGYRQGMFGAKQGGDTSGYGLLRRPVLIAGETTRPYGSFFDEVADALERALVGGSASFGEAVAAVVIDRGEMTINVHREHLVAVARALRDDPALRFEICTGVSGVHYPDRVGEELHAVYHFLSITHGSRRIRVEVSCPEEDRHIPSIVEVYPANDWHERETWDMFGIEFDGHPALTRVLMPDDWPGHPQRKDYPLGGIPVEYKGATVPPPDQRRSYN
ncbi:NADH-quinone oxidoreductase subunit C [Intrasporangium calvum]|uniref:NADH-quinone oxidoreductase subunit C n=1 Tax=Intrasporangium calvum TaxID=53358 RepID=UPI000DF608D2|nr:NADH-quinone oxidoreductase subunit C [Intrasporangium calvum]AXG12474.1 NADH-quinone oxidoreductase subunit C [Intrasporangium calvum]